MESVFNYQFGGLLRMNFYIFQYNMLFYQKGKCNGQKVYSFIYKLYVFYNLVQIFKTQVITYSVDCEIDLVLCD